MKENKSILIIMATAVLLFILSGSVLAEEKHYKTGVGYQGMISAEFLNGISARTWIDDNFGLEGNFFCGSVDVDAPGLSFDADLFALEAKAMYAPIVRQNSKFYFGVNLGWEYIDLDENEDIWTMGIFLGSEWNFQGIPELGFNFDIGYRYATYDDDYFEVDLDGIAATFGIHYYF